MLLKYILLLAFCSWLTNAAWVSPFFKEGPRTEVTFRTSGETVAITMDEEIPAPITVAIVTGYDGTQKPTLGVFDFGNNIDLGLDFLLNSENEWEVVVTKKQDYEQAGMQQYNFNVQIDGQRVFVQILINNIFDNAPVMTAETNPCVIEELLPANFESNCIYNVFDIDGMIGNQITFRIDGKYNEDELFEFRRISEIGLYTYVYRLIVKQTLFYDQRALYNFRTWVFDIGGNNGSTNIFIEVEDMPNKEPMWMKAFASARFPEKKKQTFDVIAIDGDTGIDTDICYRLDFEADKDYSEFISIGENSGVIDVDEINRDEMKNEFFPFAVIAYKCNNHSSLIRGSAALIVDDINDNLPEIYFDGSMTSIKIREETFGTLFTPSNLFVEDLDLGSHATYIVILTEAEGAEANFAEAFNIIPGNGYQRQTFTISVADASLIDYEDPKWQNFEITIKATETDFQDHETTKTFKVELMNWNDELPMFEKDEYIFQVLETEGIDYPIGFLNATDRDLGDEIRYFISGRINESIAVNMNSGQLFTLVDRAFDYERQTEVFIQVQARDTMSLMGEPTHSTFTQVRIEVIDVNDEPPQLRMPREILSITENVRDEIITSKIEATDPDTGAILRFSINWADSYAVKPGFEVERKYFEGCFVIEEFEENRNKVFGILSANTSFEYNIDYEKFEIVYLSIIVEDIDQEIMPNTDFGTLVIRINDENDNPPEFVDDTLTISRRVFEEAEANVPIGNIIARDIDGPGNNVIQYSINATDDTPDGWVSIDSATGTIKVLGNRVIGCDVPVRDSLTYEVTLDDGANKTRGMIAIDIVDINNKLPQEDDFDSEIYLYENATTGDVITQVLVIDLDRDYPHNVVQFFINYRIYPDLQRFFAVDGTSGVVSVNLFGGNELDRDNGEFRHSILINFEDNYNGNGVRNGNQTTVVLILKDVNDNAPEMPEKSEYELDENASEHHVLDEQFYAHDRDDPDTPNAQVLYQILSIEPVEVFAADPTNFDTLFEIESYDNKYGRIRTTKSIRGFSGRWSVEIRAYDRGDEWDSRISLSSTKSYSVNIKPFNYNAPRLEYPRRDAAIRLDFGSIEPGTTLTLINGNPLSPFEAVDDDAGIFGDITFDLTSESDDHSYFEMFKLDRKQSELRVKAGGLEERTYTLTVIATDGGLLSDRVNNVRVSFVNKTGEPYFITNTWSTDFTENVEGRGEIRVVPEAFDPKNVAVVNPEDLFTVYYFLDESYRPDDNQFFALDKVTRELTLIKDLDRETVDRHQIRIFSTNLESYPATRPAESSLLTVDITVNDVNDNPPTFQNKNYAVGISERDNRGKILMTLYATDPDLDDVVTYFLLTETIVATGENLENVKQTAFVVDRRSGALTLNFELQSNMKGFFEFQVQARDLVDHTDEASVKIYLIAEANRVTFVFDNAVATVLSVDRESLAAVFTNAYESECIIDEIMATTEQGVAKTMETDLRVHFVKNNEAIDAEEIEQKSNDLVFITKLNSDLIKLGLSLQGLPTSNTSSQEPSRNNLIEILLAVLSGVLGALLVTLAVIYFMKGRSYQRQIDVLTASTFDSKPSELNRNIQPLPNTNVFSHEQSNPVMNNPKWPKPDLDTTSIISSDSDDFAGLGDNPIFNVDNGQSKNPLAQKVRDTDSNDSSYI